MTNQNLEHPTEEALERFLLDRSEDQELEVLETHLLACESCVTRLEALELQLSDLKTALVGFEQDRIRKESQPAAARWKSWISIPNLSWAGAACAALIVGLTITPTYLHRKTSTGVGSTEQIAATDLSVCSGPDVTLSSCRDMETTTLPVRQPLYLRLDTTDIPAGAVDVEVVSGTGAKVWNGQTEVKNERAAVQLPRIAEPGPYFLRFYARSAQPDRQLLREFRFELK